MEKSIVQKKVSVVQNKNSYEAAEEQLQTALQNAIANVSDDGIEGGKDGEESDEEPMNTPKKKKPVKSAKKKIVNIPEYNDNCSDDSIDEAFKNIPTSNQLHSKDLSDLQGSCATGRKNGQIWMKKISHKGKMESIEMVPMSRGVSIPLQNWRITTARSKTRSIFVKKMSRNLLGPERLANRSVDYSSKCQKVTRDSLRKQLTPKKMKVLKHCYHAFLTNIKPSLVGEREYMATVLSEITSILSEEIGTQIKNFKAGRTAKTPMCVQEPYDGDESDDSLIYEEDSLVYAEN
ncbi:uncharacterized protein LOC111693795 [Trichogramma pretiosum]|uniref:uncharacterized protein LOC111693795 n=1 Tax=Trichogramma pretiosum TaxID=7493 RepID=UPI000C718D75|nr:uncharacterized protein LOC111693795 [Trichogramma pretiosum]